MVMWRKKKETAQCGCGNLGLGRIEYMNGGSVAVYHDKEAAKIQGNRADNILALLYGELHEFTRNLNARIKK